MASYGQSITIVYYAYNSSTGAYVTGDAANHTLKLLKDGAEASPTNSPAEIDAVNWPGAYSLILTAAEMQHNCIVLGGKSSTANVLIIGITVTTEQLPAALTAGGYVKSDPQAISGVVQSAVNLQRSTAAICTGTVGTGSTTTNIVVSSINPSMVVSGQFIGRIVIFDEVTTTAALRGQATNITANDASGNITVTSLTTAPVSGDTFTVS